MTQIRRSLNRMLAPLGYAVVAKRSLSEGLFALHDYRRPDGTFDYARYRSVQEEGNRAKLDRVWVNEENIAFLSRYLRDLLPTIDFGLCHGTRRGLEQGWFRQYLGGGAEVVGTEIADSASDFPHTIQWDFHEIKDEWLGAVDFIYSNSFDHAYDPDKALNAWMRCLKPHGVCVLEHTRGHTPDRTSELDPFGAHLEVMPYLIASWGRGAFAVTEILEAPVARSKRVASSFLVIEPRHRHRPTPPGQQP